MCNAWNSWGWSAFCDFITGDFVRVYQKWVLEQKKSGHKKRRLL